MAEPFLAPGERGFDRHVVLWLSLGYPLPYALGFLSKATAGSAAIWPAHALTFAAFLLLPPRLWTLVALGVLSWEMLTRPLLYWVTIQSPPSLAETCGYAVANILTAAGPAALARIMRLFRRRERFGLVISPLWIVALFAGSLPGALLGAATRAHAGGIAFVPADMGLWVLASVLTIVTFGPMVFGLLLGFAEPVRTPARAWEGWGVAATVAALFTCFATVPWAAVDQLVAPMLLAAPLAWLALRFPRRATNLGVRAAGGTLDFDTGLGEGCRAMVRLPAPTPFLR